MMMMCRLSQTIATAVLLRKINIVKEEEVNLHVQQ